MGVGRSADTMLNIIRFLPLILLFQSSPARETIEKDISQWVQVLQPMRSGLSALVNLIWLLDLENVEEFRNLFYYRIGIPLGGWNKFLLGLAKKLCKPRDSLYIETSSIGPGILIRHGVATVIQAERIGRECLIFQEVVIGPKMDGAEGKPIIGDYVRISAGAKVLGPITIGDHSIIGANAVVTKDVGPNCIAVGVPAKIVSLERGKQ